MAKTAKNSKKKVVKLELPAPVVPVSAEAVKMALDMLEVSTGWLIVKRILDENIKYLELCIINKFDPVTKIALNEKELDEMRLKRELNIDLRDTPANYKIKIDESGIVPKDFDPYFRTNAEVLKAEGQ